MTGDETGRRTGKRGTRGRTIGHRIGSAFDRASHYDEAARMQQIAARRLDLVLAGRFSRDDAPRRILELGCGTGLLTACLRDRYPEARIVAIDLSPRMIARARARVPDAIFHVMDAERPTLDESFDLICSNFCIQWFSNRKAAFARLAHCLVPDGRMEITTLARGSFAEWRAACAATDLPCAIPDYPGPDRLQQDWPVSLAGQWQCETLHDPVGSGRDFLRGLKTIGATARTADIRPATPAALRRAIETFDRNANSMTYEIAFGAAQKSRGLFVAGTDTGIGKTLVSAIVVRALDAHYWKPFQTGLADETGDTDTVRTLAALDDTRIVAPAYALRAPLSPDAAARREGRQIDISTVTLPECDAPLVVEGAGGLMVPLAGDLLLIDWLRTLGLPVLLVARSGLGTLNHTLLSLEALASRNIRVAGLVLNGPPNPDNRETLTRLSGIPVLAEIPEVPTPDPAWVAAQARQLAHTLTGLGF